MKLPLEAHTLIKKMHSHDSSEHFLSWIFNYIIDRRHFVQTVSNISDHLITNFVVPKRST